MNRNVSLDILRILACIAVITIHTAGSIDYHGLAEPGSFDWIFGETLDALSRWSVPIFAMLTGVFFLNPQKDISLKKLYTENIIRLISVMVFWVIVYSITLKKIFYPFDKSLCGHFWYLGMTIGLYLAMPILRKIAADDSLLHYFCWVWLGCKVYLFIGKFIVLPFNLYSLLFVDYAGYCLWAYYLSKIKLQKSYEILLYLFTTIALIITVSAYMITKSRTSFWSEYDSVPTIITSIGLFYFFSHITIKLPSSNVKWIQNCAQCTLGIYAVHILLLTECFTRIHRFIPSWPITVIISIVSVFIIGWIITFILKKIPVIGKYIV